MKQTFEAKGVKDVFEIAESKEIDGQVYFKIQWLHLWDKEELHRMGSEAYSMGWFNSGEYLLLTNGDGKRVLWISADILDSFKNLVNLIYKTSIQRQQKQQKLIKALQS